MGFKEYLKEKGALVENKLQELSDGFERLCPKLCEAMTYSLMAGGKRLRPVMLMAAAEAVGERGEKFIQTACALEMIHTYSLIHDDLPAMDDDDYRRGKLTNHKVFGEAMAILAGDALLTMAFEAISAQEDVAEEKLLRVFREISAAAGAAGMVGGQAIDLLSEDKAVGIETLRQMHAAKTGALFRAAVRSGAILADASEEELAALTLYAEKFGLAFQITDDILDVVGDAAQIGKPVGSDEKNHKSTYVTIYSLEKARELAKEAVSEAVNALSVFGSRADFLRELVTYLIERRS
jgi:geranylgeranyl diphosphate synthase type II